ncbi:MAG TPA: rhodanese-like domain-containing protein [Gammaproteobacteria bacterium]|nr:rhodanese-like domain-containing protein [Gammaproteobacteria bacterium]
MAAVPELAPAEARRLLQAAGAQGVILDVREPWEYALVHVPGALHIPMGDIPARLEELNPDRTYVVMCHHGSRSQRVADFLQSRGFRQVANAAGGIDAWAGEDTSLPRY